MTFPSSPPQPSAALDERPRFLSAADCQTIAQRLARAAEGGGVTAVMIWSQWTGTVRWARNLISSSSEVRNNYIRVIRDVHGASNAGWVLLNETTDTALVAAARRAERLTAFVPQQEEADLLARYQLEPALTPTLFSDATYQLDAEHRTDAAIALAKAAADAGMLSAGTIEVSANSQAVIDSQGRARYCPYTTASYNVTVRDPSGSGSGWAGVDWPDWSRINASQLSAIALDKCLTSRNPVAIEPGRYTTILEHQAVCDFVGQLMYGGAKRVMEKSGETWEWGNSKHLPFIGEQVGGDAQDPGMSLLGQKIMDERITIRSDPMDPDLGFPPFSLAVDNKGVPMDWKAVDVYHPVTWIERGVLTALTYDRAYGVVRQGHDTGLPIEGAFRMSGGDTSVTEMIRTTKRGLLVTRFDRVVGLDLSSLLCRGYTRDGLWLIENGAISKPMTNMAFTESILFALNNIEQLGVPQRVYHPATGRLMIPQPAIVPALKIRDFSFTALASAV